MFFNNPPQQRHPKDEGASLTSVLGTPDLRVELALLFLLCIDDMRDDLVANFDPDKTRKTDSSTALLPPTRRTRAPVYDLISFDEPRNDAKIATESDEFDSTQMQALQRSALTFFDKWRAGVMHRICDVLCVRGDTVRQAKARRKQMLEDAERHKQGISSLIDFDDDDPFASQASARSEKRKHGHYEVIESKLLVLEDQKRALILHCLLLLLLSLEQYSAHSRVLLLRLTSSLELKTDLLGEHERSVAQGLLASAASQMDAEATTKKQASSDAVSRKWKVGLAAVGGAVLIGVTGGLAAPLLAAGFGTVMGGLGLGVVSTYLGALAGSSVLVGSLFGAYGAKMTGKLMDQYAKEVQDFEFVPVQDPYRTSIQCELDWADEQDARDPTKREQHRLRVCIGISGWLSSPSDVNKPWEVIDAATTEPFALRFELDAMLRLGNSLNDVLFSYAWDGVAYTVVSRTLLGALYAGLWPLGLIKAASVLDNPFSVALARAEKAGKVLAHALIDGVQGKRPVTLIGYSVGARVIYACLIELADQHAFGLVESVTLMGTPAPSDSKPWRRIRSVVAGRVVNVYSTEDYVLGFLYRSTKLQVGVAGLQEVEDVYGIENVDASKTVSGHDQYRYRVGMILAQIGFGDLNFKKVAEQERAFAEAESKKQQAKEQVQGKTQNKRTNSPSSRAAKVLISTPRDTSHPIINLSTSKPNVSTNTVPIERPGFPRTELILPITSTFHPPQAFSATDQPSTALSDPTGPVKLPAVERQDIHEITMINLDSHDPIMSQSFSIRALKTGTDIVVTDIPFLQGDDSDGNFGNRTDHGDADHIYDHDVEVSSDFGELSVVEPVPMDDFDYGLM
ncbi:DUF726-domain-containing protein [Clathrospora elynae]|uniref:DUF726-domain-containing protein n=1 Tax=Clathrospora elynae TaxID=706981 RepID=A0A6A5SW85_9PLEO|nr:DUF726-domain-containing protein [Clathrospora elynae]